MLLALGGCPGGFTRETALFGPEEGVAALGERGTLSVPGLPEQPLQIPFERNGSVYDLLVPTPRDLPHQVNRPQVTFIPINETLEEDFIAQIRLSSDEVEGEANFYVFVLRTPRGTLRMVSDPLAVKDEFESSPSDGLCRPNGRSNAECEFNTRADMIEYYATYVRQRLAADCDPSKCEVTVVSEQP